MSPTALRVLISGGGIAGNALAFWLARQGHHVTVVERFPSLRTTGLQIDLRGPGIVILRRMGLEDAFRAKAAPEQGMQVVDRTGRRRAYFPANKPGSGKKQSLTSEYEMMRGDLCRLLHDAAVANNNNNNNNNNSSSSNTLQYIYGTSVESFEQTPEAVTVRFEDGTTDRFDLLVGADGQWSRTRRMLLGSGTPDALQRIPGLYFTYFTMAKPMQQGEEFLATTYMAPGRRGIMTRRHSPDHIQVLLSCKTNPDHPLEKVDRGDVAREKEVMADIFKGAGWIADEVLTAMRDADDFYCERPGVVKPRAWSSGRVTLIGDAAHCPTALSGMGTTCAMVGAYILAGEIGRYCGQLRVKGANAGDDASPKSVAAALEEYERKFRPFMDGIQEGIVEKADAQWVLAGSKFSIGVGNFLMGVFSFLKVNIADIFSIRETVKGWSLPEYENVEQK